MNCKICLSSTVKKFDKQLKCNFYFCESCGFIFKDKRGYLEFEKQKEHYAKHDNSMENTGYVEMYKTFLSEIEPYLSNVDLALDYGCGPGPVLQKLLSDKKIKTKTYDLFFSHSMDYAQYKYDLITSTEVIEHFINPLEELKKILELLKPSGLLVIKTMFIQKPFLNWWYRRDYTHVSFFNNKVFEEISKKLNLKIIYSNNEDIVIFKKYF